jgi:hypothetical protein
MNKSGVDQTVGREAMVGGVGEGEGRRGSEGPSGIVGGMLLFNAACGGDTVTVRTLLSAADAQSLINYQDQYGRTVLFVTADEGYATVTKQLIEARCNIEYLQRASISCFVTANWIETLHSRALQANWSKTSKQVKQSNWTLWSLISFRRLRKNSKICGVCVGVCVCVCVCARALVCVCVCVCVCV